MMALAITGLAGGLPAAGYLETAEGGFAFSLPYLFAGASGALAVASALTALALWRRLRESHRHIKMLEGREREDMTAELVFMAAPRRLMPASPATLRFLKDALRRPDSDENVGLDGASLEKLVGPKTGARLNLLIADLVRKGRCFRFEAEDAVGGVWSFIGETIGARTVVRLIPLGPAEAAQDSPRAGRPSAAEASGAAPWSRTSGVEEAGADAARTNATDADFLALLEAAPAGAIAFGADGRMIAANRMAQQLLRLSAEWTAGRPSLRSFLDQLHRRQRMPEQAHYARWRDGVMADPARALAEPSLWALPNSEALRVSTAETPSGGFVFFVEDETSARSQERRFRIALGARRATIAAVDQGLAVVGGDGAVQLLNPAFARIWDLDRAFGADCGERFMDEGAGGRLCLTEVAAAAIANDVPEDRQIWEKLQTLLGEGPRRVEEFTVTRSGEAEQTLAIRITPLPDGASLISCLDVSDAKAVERALRDRAEALEAADKLKTEFLTDMAYQLRTPLNAVIGFADMLDQGHAGPLGDKQKDYVGYVLSAANDLRELISDALDLGALRAGSLALRSAPFDLCAAAATVSAMAAKRAERRNALMVSNIPPMRLPVLGDERRLRHALFGALTAAINDAESGDEARLVLRPAILEDGSQAAEVMISLARRKPKRKLSEDPGAEVGGVSLSLAVRIVEAHDGRASAEETPEGLRARFVLPLTDVELQEDNSRAAGPGRREDGGARRGASG